MSSKEEVLLSQIIKFYQKNHELGKLYCVKHFVAENVSKRFFFFFAILKCGTIERKSRSGRKALIIHKTQFPIQNVPRKTTSFALASSRHPPEMQKWHRQGFLKISAFQHPEEHREIAQRVFPMKIWERQEIKVFQKFFFLFNTWLPRYGLGTVFLKRLLPRMKMGLLFRRSVQNIFLRNFLMFSFKNKEKSGMTWSSWGKLQEFLCYMGMIEKINKN